MNREIGLTACCVSMEKLTLDCAAAIEGAATAKRKQKNGVRMTGILEYDWSDEHSFPIRLYHGWK